MLKMKIVMDEKKIVEDDEVTITNIHNKIKKVFNNYSFEEVENNIFAHVSNIYNEKKITEILSAYIIAFSKCEWFMKYVKEWTWINDVTNYREDIMNTVNIYGR